MPTILHAPFSLDCLFFFPYTLSTSYPKNNRKFIKPEKLWWIISKDAFRALTVFLLFLFALTSIMTTECTVTSYKGFRNGTNPADFAVINAKIFTSDEANPWAEAVAIKNERVVYVGGDQGVK